MCDLGVNSLRQQHGFPCRLMLRAGAVEFLGVQYLAGIVHSNTEFDPACIASNAELGIGIQQTVRSLTDQFKMP